MGIVHIQGYAKYMRMYELRIAVAHAQSQFSSIILVFQNKIYSEMKYIIALILQVIHAHYTKQY